MIVGLSTLPFLLKTFRRKSQSLPTGLVSAAKPSGNAVHAECSVLHDGRVKISRSRLLAALLAVDAFGAVVAARHRIAGEPFGLGASFDVRRPSVLVFWGSGLSAPLASLLITLAVHRRYPAAVRALGALFAIGALSEPVFWGRRECPLHGRVLVGAHVALGTALAVG